MPEGTEPYKISQCPPNIVFFFYSFRIIYILIYIERFYVIKVLYITILPELKDGVGGQLLYYFLCNILRALITFIVFKLNSLRE